ncbi:hypothetical protein [Sodalis-like endosymbiont of Proechinophthirus fluctus]|uniref:hypothetical protein n=1 Tax=Sodalis-like endosymbiont of Proechinophthirus fluctus TaxID=1462730 RepID=UPI001FCB4D40|nr:hypothetical protein [Sodalis-like endosymbiont of Proechinophthirus fluctus]
MTRIAVLQPTQRGSILMLFAHGVNVANDRSGMAIGALLAESFLTPVLTGLHQGMVPLHVELIQSHGVNPLLLPMIAIGRMGQVGASFAVLLKTRCARLKMFIRARLTGIFPGIVLESRCFSASHTAP